jgi:hypothetical protein
MVIPVKGGSNSCHFCQTDIRKIVPETTSDLKKRVDNPNKGDTFLHQSSKALNQNINAKTQRKAKEVTKGNCFRFVKYFFFAVFLYHSAPLR